MNIQASTATRNRHTSPHILIIDDEAPARERLRRLLGDIENACAHVVVGEAAGAQQAVEFLSNKATHVDIVLLDVQMPGMNGIELAQHISRLPHAPWIIFVTAYDQFAVQAFELHALDYLMKPIRAARLLKSLQRVTGLQHTQAIVAAAQDIGQNQALKRTHIVVHERGRVLLIAIAEIIYFKAELKYVTLRTSVAEYLTEETLATLEHELADDFIRIHRNALVAKHAIVGFERSDQIAAHEGHWQIVLRDIHQRLPISRRQWPLVKELLRTHQVD